MIPSATTSTLINCVQESGRQEASGTTKLWSKLIPLDSAKKDTIIIEDSDGDDEFLVPAKKKPAPTAKGVSFHTSILASDSL